MERREQHRAEKVKRYGEEKVKILENLERDRTLELIVFVKTIDGQPVEGEGAQKNEEHELFQLIKTQINELIETTLVKHRASDLHEEELATSFVNSFNEIVRVKDHNDNFTESAVEVLIIFQSTIKSVQMLLESGKPEEKKFLPTLKPAQKKQKDE
jgi:hypothetical protein